MALKEIFEVSKPRIIVLLVITAVTSMYAGSKLVGPEIGYLEILHIIIAGSLASAGSSALQVTDLYHQAEVRIQQFSFMDLA